MKFKIALLCLFLFLIFYQTPTQKLSHIVNSAPSISITDSILSDLKRLKEKGFRISRDDYFLIYQQPGLKGEDAFDALEMDSGNGIEIFENEYVIGKVDFCSQGFSLLMFQELKSSNSISKRVTLNRYDRSYNFMFQVLIFSNEKSVSLEKEINVKTETDFRKGVLITKKKKMILNPNSKLGSLRITEEKLSLCGLFNNPMEQELFYLENKKSEILNEMWESN